MSDIRQQIRAFSLSEAEGPDRDIIIRLYEAFDEHNERFWNGVMEAVPILITPPTSPRAFADAAEFSGFGCRQQLRVRPTIAQGTYPTKNFTGATASGWRMRQGHDLENRVRWLSDVVLHEMIHLWLNQVDDPLRHEHQGHGKPFVAECNRIGAMLGLPNVVTRRRKGAGDDVLISPEWPLNCRPGGMHGPYFGTLWERVEGEKEVELPWFDRACAKTEALLKVLREPAVSAEERAKYLAHYGFMRGATDGDREPPAPTVSSRIAGGRSACRHGRRSSD